MIRLKARAITPYIYYNEFGREIFADIDSVVKPDVKKIDSQTLLEIAYSMAKTADKSIDGYEEWLDKLGKINFAALARDVLRAAKDFF